MRTLSAIIFSVIASTANAAEFSISAGQSVRYSDALQAEVSVRHGSWDASLGRIYGRNFRGMDMPSTTYFSVSRLFDREDGGVFYRLGVAKTPGQDQMIGPYNFRLGLGYATLSGWEIEYTHLSSARIYVPNWGFDAIQIRKPISF